jgi:hypothetical protein
MAAMKCETCKYWFRQRTDGECRRFPPRNFFVGVQENLGRQIPAFTSAFPAIGADRWCGEYQQKIELQS